VKKFTVILFLLLASCGKHDDRTVIEFWTLQLSPTFNDYFFALIAEYERTHPGVNIKWVDVPYDAAIQKLLSSAVAGNAPDVVNLSADFLAKFNGMNALADITSEVERCGYTFLPNALELCTYNNKIVALPWYLNSYVVIYNREFIRNAGMDDDDIPVTYTELVNFVRTYKDRTGKFAMYWNIGKDSYLPMMLVSEGVEMIDRNMSKALFNSPRGIDLIDQWVQLYRDGYLQSESIIKPGSTIVEAYQSGQVALIFTGPVFLKRIQSNSPKIFAVTGVAPVVTGVTGRHDLAAMAISVLSTGKQKKIATDFALFLTNPENQLAFGKLTTTYPSVVEALRDSFFTLTDGTLLTKARKLGAEQLSTATRLRNYLDHPDFDRLRDSFDEAIQRACLGKVSTREALDNAAAEWNAILRH
jgi:putative chitobiose transport system substrate-binding protein